MIPDKQPPRSSLQQPPPNWRVPGNATQVQHHPFPPKAAASPRIDPQMRLRMEAERAQREARAARETLIAASLSAIIVQPDHFGPLGIQAYTKKFVEEAGAPEDPVERVLIEQLLLAHHRAAQLQCRAEQSRNLEEVKILTTSATRLVGEIRRLALAIKHYRAPIGSRHFTVVHQQNVASGAEQRVNYVDQSTKEQENVSFSSSTELCDRSDEAPDGNPLRSRAPEESQSRSRRADQRLQAAAVDG